jgi:hypothetical protein
MECGNSVVELGELVLGTMLVSELDPPTPEWDQAIERLLRYLQRHETPVERLRLLTITQGGSPTTRQRAELKVAFEGRHPKVSVISTALDSPLKRGIATALQWINPRVGLFAPNQALEALEYLDLLHAQDKVLELFLGLEQQMRPLPVMRVFAQQLRAAPVAAAAHESAAPRSGSGRDS